MTDADQAKNPEIPLSIDDTFDPKWHEERNSRGVLVFLSSHLQDFEVYAVRPTSSKQSAELFKGKADEFQTKIGEIEKKLAGFSQERLDEAMQEMGQIQRTISEHAKSNAKKKGKKSDVDFEDAQLEEDLHALEEEIEALKALKDGEQDMRAQVEKLSASARQMMVRAEFYSQFAGHVERRHFVIPILLPGFNMSVTECDRRGGKWWPAEMPELEGAQLVDLRCLLKGGDGVNPEELQVRHASWMSRFISFIETCLCMCICVCMFVCISIYINMCVYFFCRLEVAQYCDSSIGISAYGGPNGSL
jgi:hypothetical protein